MKWILKLFGGKVRLINLSEQTERGIMEEMAKIGKIREFWELHKQAGYQLYAKTDDRRYLGYTDMANTMLTGFDTLLEKEDVDNSRGYESVI